MAQHNFAQMIALDPSFNTCIQIAMLMLLQLWTPLALDENDFNVRIYYALILTYHVQLKHRNAR